MRARYPDREGVKSNASVPIAWEEYGTGASTVLCMPPVTRVLEARGETVHPASHLLAGESAHFESEAREHDLHVFHAWRNMDEILVANFMVLHDLLEAEPYDLVVGDEAWEVDYQLHENPELKRTPFVWLTDFIGWLPMNTGTGWASGPTSGWSSPRWPAPPSASTCCAR